MSSLFCPWEHWPRHKAPKGWNVWTDRAGLLRTLLKWSSDIENLAAGQSSCWWSRTNSSPYFPWVALCALCINESGSQLTPVKDFPCAVTSLFSWCAGRKLALWNNEKNNNNKTSCRREGKNTSLTLQEIKTFHHRHQKQPKKPNCPDRWWAIFGAC